MPLKHNRMEYAHCNNIRQMFFPKPYTNGMEENSQPNEAQGTQRYSKMNKRTHETTQ